MRAEWDMLLSEIVGGTMDPDAPALANRIEACVRGIERQRDAHFAEIERARDHITALTLYRERLVCFISKTTSDQRDRIHELSGNDCDYDRSVRELLADFRALSTLAAQEACLPSAIGTD